MIPGKNGIRQMCQKVSLHEWLLEPTHTAGRSKVLIFTSFCTDAEITGLYLPYTHHHITLFALSFYKPGMHNLKSQFIDFINKSILLNLINVFFHAFFILDYYYSTTRVSLANYLELYNIIDYCFLLFCVTSMTA